MEADETPVPDNMTTDTRPLIPVPETQAMKAEWQIEEVKK